MAALDEVLEKLNPEQHRAATSPSPRILVIAGAGSGKTAVLTTRIAYLQLHERVGTTNMLALTFTRLAAAEMKERVGRILGEDLAKRLTAGTFHSFCARVLRTYGYRRGLEQGFTIYDEEDRDAILGEIIADLGLAAKVHKADVNPWRESHDPYVQQVAAEYRYRLRRNNATDLDGLLYLTLDLLTYEDDVAQALRSRYTHVLVDEYQDTDDRQEAILQAISPRNLFVVGDPSQAIYGWRGARIENILTFEERYPDTEVVCLERNYRSTQEILGLANRVIALGRHKSPLELWTDRSGPEPENLHASSDVEEAAQIARRLQSTAGGRWNTIAILCRTNAQVALYDAALQQAGIPTYLVSPRADALRSYDVRRLLDYMAWLCNPKNGRAFRRICNWPKRRLSDVQMLDAERRALTLGRDPLEVLVEASRIAEEGAPPAEAWTTATTLLSWICEWLHIRDAYAAQGLTNRTEELDRAFEAIARWEARQAALGEPVSPQACLTWLRTRDIQDRLVQERPEGVSILTVHAAKGLEWEHVIVPGCNQDVFPNRRGDGEEERRLFYVAVTRAKRTLWLSRADERIGRDGTKRPLRPSPYLSALAPETSKGVPRE